MTGLARRSLLQRTLGLSVLALGALAIVPLGGLIKKPTGRTVPAPAGRAGSG